MRQAKGEKLTADVLAAAPLDGTGDTTDGFDIDATQGQAKVLKWFLRMTSASAVDWAIWGYDADSGDWTDVTSFVVGYTKVNGRTGFVVENLGIFTRVAVVGASITGAYLQEFIENNFLRGD